MAELCDERLNEIYHALSSPTRRRIVSLLARQSRNIAQLTPEFCMTLAAVSKHVKILERAGIVRTELIGRAHVCQLETQGLSDAYAWLDGYQHFWRERLDVLEGILAETDEQKSSPETPARPVSAASARAKVQPRRRVSYRG